MNWALLISGTCITLSVLGYSFYITQDTRKLMRHLRGAEKLATKLQRDLTDEQHARWNETLTMQAMLERRDKAIAVLESHIDELEGLVADAGGDVIAVRRLRLELSKARAADSGDGDDGVPN